MMRDHLTPDQSDAHEFVATARQFFLEQGVGSHTFTGFNSYIGGGIGCNNLADKILNFKKSSCKEKQEAIIKIQTTWKSFIRIIQTYLDSFETESKDVLTNDNKMKFINSRQVICMALQQFINDIIDQVTILKKISSTRHLSGTTGMIKYGMSFITWKSSESITETDCTEILDDLKKLKLEVASCNIKEMSILSSKTLTGK